MNQVTSSEFSPFLAVHASAGSGKTYQLVSRIIRLLLMGAQPGGILSITFTRKAAAEMQQRLLSRVKELANMADSELDTALNTLGMSANDNVKQLARNLYEQLLHSDYPVRATTFHAFCQDLLRRFPMEADIPPGFELIERTRQLIDEAWEAFSTTLTQNPDSDTARAMDVLLQQLGLYNTRIVLNEFIEHRSDWWALTKSQSEPCKFVYGLLQQRLPDVELKPVKNLFSNVEFISDMQEFVELLRKHPVQANNKAVSAIEKGLDDQTDAAQRLSSIWPAFFTTEDEPRKRDIKKTTLQKMGEAGAQRHLELHQKLCDTLINVKREQHALDTLRLTSAWLTCGEVYLAHFQRIKSSQRLLDFADLEWNSYLLLNEADHADWIQYKLDQRIEHLLIDEFQDTNQVQWQLVLPLLQELAASDDKRHRSVMLVGDSKQSIYRFRRAEPKLFDAASQWLIDRLAARTATLRKSWRSSPAIINFVNRVFTNNDDLPLSHFETHETVHDYLWGMVTLLPLSLKDKKEKQTGLRNPLTTPRAQEDPSHYLEARLIADTIQQLIEQPLILGQAETSRPINYSDIMILFRHRTHASEYERALREAHIPYLGTERGTLLESLEVSDMVNLLKWLITPFDNLALAGILRSPLFSATNEDLLLLADKGNWFTHLISLKEKLDGQHPIARAALHLQNWLALADSLPVHDLLDHIYSEANVLARYKAAFPEHLHARVIANLTRFLELALENDSGRYPSLTRFIAWLNILKQHDREAPDQPPGLGEQARVRLLTVHEAKGLEAPVVFIADATSKPNTDKGVRILVDWPGESSAPTSFLLSPSGKYPNTFSEKLIAYSQGREEQEDANLLYVALTRAEQLLYISGSNKAAGWYEKICKACEINPEELDAANVIEQANIAPAAISQPQKQIRQQAQIDARLQAPVKLPPAFQEIAPSYEVVRSLHRQTHIDEDARLRGVVIHSMLEQLAADNEISLDAALNKSGHCHYAECDSWWEEAQQVTRSFPEFFNSEQFDHAASEVPISYIEGDKVVNGIIDRMIVYPDRICVIDYKTHRIVDRKEMVALAAQYKEQLRLYHDGVQKIYPHLPVSTCLLFTAMNECKYFEFG